MSDLAISQCLTGENLCEKNTLTSWNINTVSVPVDDEQSRVH